MPVPTAPGVAALLGLAEELRSSDYSGVVHARRSERLVGVGIAVGCGLGSGSSIEVAVAVAGGIAAGSAMRFGFAGIDWESACCWGRRLGFGSQWARGGEMLRCSLDALLDRRNGCALLGEIGMWWT